MITLLITISFLLHLIAFTAIYQLFRKQQLSQQGKSTEDILLLFETYLEEVKTENRRLQKELTQIQGTSTSDNKNDSTFSTENETSQSSHIIEQDEHLPDNVIDTFETSLHAKVLQLYHQGLTEEEIARKLNCGKTEAALMIKLHAKKNSYACLD